MIKSAISYSVMLWKRLERLSPLSKIIKTLVGLSPFPLDLLLRFANKRRFRNNVNIHILVYECTILASQPIGICRIIWVYILLKKNLILFIHSMLFRTFLDSLFSIERLLEKMLLLDLLNHEFPF